MPPFASPVWLSPWDWSSSDWAGLTFIVIVVAAGIAWRHANEAKRLREEQARPFVLIDFHVWSTIIELRIVNIGKTLARKVHFDFDPPLTTTYDETSGRGDLMDLNVFKAGIPSLAPGKEIKFFFDGFPARLERGLPLTYDVGVSYEDPAGHPYSEPNVLDLSMYVGTGGIKRNDLHEIHKELKSIADTLKKWSDWEGLKILTRADRKKRQAEREAEYEAEQEAATRAGNGASSRSDESDSSTEIPPSA